MSYMTPPLFQLFAICKRTNSILYAIGSPDTYDRCHNLKRAQSNYQPKCWFAVLEPSTTVGSIVPTT